MKPRNVLILLLIAVFLSTILWTGCTVSISSDEVLQLNLSKLDEKTVSLIAEFENQEEERVAGDVTQKAGSVCAGGACIVY